MGSYKIILASILSLMLFSCSDIDGLNDYNAVFSFAITEHKGAGGDIRIGETTMSGNNIHIPVLYGIHNFPLYFKGQPHFENPIDRVTGLDFDDWIEIDIQRGGESGDEPVLDEQGNYIFETPKFYVQALSGMPREYTFRIDYTSTSRDADIFPSVSFPIPPQGAVVADLLTIATDGITGEGNLALINIAVPQFPVTLTPQFTLSDGATLNDNGSASYKFSDKLQRHSFDVVASDGTVKRWTLGLSVLPLVNAADGDVDAAMLEPTNLAGFTAEPGSRGFSIEEYRFCYSRGEDIRLKTAVNGGTEKAAGKTIPGKQSGGDASGCPEVLSVKSFTDVAQVTAYTPVKMAATGKQASLQPAGYMPADTLRLYVNTFSGNPFPLEVQMEIPLPSGVSLTGAGKEVVFASMDAVNEFWLLDTVNGIARRWVVALEEYSSPVAMVMEFSYDYTASGVRENSLSDPEVPAIVMDGEKSVEIDAVNRCIYLRAVEINNPRFPLVDPWKLNMAVSIKVTGGASLVDISNFDWNGTDSWKDPKTFGVQASDGTVYRWKVVIRDWSDGGPAASDGSELKGVSIIEVRPYCVEMEPDPVTIDDDNSTVTFNLAKDDNGYPLSVAVGYDLSEYARISTQNGGRDPLVFDSPEAVNTVEVVSESGKNSRSWSFRLRPPLKQTGTDVTSFRIISFSGSGFAAQVEGIDKETAVVNVNFTKTGSFPVTMNFRMGLSYKAESTVTDTYGSGSLDFAGVEDKAFTVTAQNGETRSWTIRCTYMPQLQNASFESWADNSTPIPKGIKGSPYWASANMTSPVVVEGTTQTDGAPGQGKAVQLSTKNTLIGKLASGSLFLGWFDDSNPIVNMNDPTVMTFQGMPFSANKRIKGFSADVSYHPGGGAASDGGSLVIELVKQRDPSQEFEYHGRRPDGQWHPRNNADMVARGQVIVATQPGKLDNGDTAGEVVADNTWQTVFVPLEYDGSYPSYTHLNIICSSSSQGDAFKGAVGSVLKLDNIKLVYEE